MQHIQLIKQIENDPLGRYKVIITCPLGHKYLDQLLNEPKLDMNKLIMEQLDLLWLNSGPSGSGNTPGMVELCEGWLTD